MKLLLFLRCRPRLRRKWALYKVLTLGDFLGICNYGLMGFVIFYGFIFLFLLNLLEISLKINVVVGLMGLMEIGDSVSLEVILFFCVYVWF